MTRRGKDDGIDVIASRAVGQVKWWLKKNVGIVDVQRLVGAAKAGQACYFFAARGYTREALKWACDPDRRISLFILHSDGNITAVNYEAKRTLWNSPTQVPTQLRKPISARKKISRLILPSVMFIILLIYFSLGFVLTPAMRNWPAFVFASGILLAYFLLIACILHSTIPRLIRYMRQPSSDREWPGWQYMLNEQVDYRDAELATDRFIGYGGSPLFFRIFSACRALSRTTRTIRRLF